MNVWGLYLKLTGWKLDITLPQIDRCVICVAPHTSNMDFFLGLAAYRSIGRRANFLMKEFWFFFPLKYLLRYFGGIPVPKKKGSQLTQSIIDKFKQSSYINLAVTPEGTRSAKSDWRKGFLYIAIGANVPILLGVIDYKNKEIIIRDQFTPSGDIEADMAYVKNYYKDYSYAARYPQKFKI
jgi:1-acyl-sn-glycerol-3-phosphate acyltransferase